MGDGRGLIAAIAALVALQWARTASRDTQKLLSAVRRGHGGEPCPDPSAAAVVTEAKPASNEDDGAEPVPVLARSATAALRLEAAETARENARARGEALPLPRLDEDDGRPTDEMISDDENTRVMSTAAARAEVAKAREASARPTLLGGRGPAPQAALTRRRPARDSGQPPVLRRRAWPW